MAKPKRSDARALPFLSKSRILSGLQCEKRLWWEVNDDDEQDVGRATEMILLQGQLVGEEARSRFKRGVLVDNPHTDVDGRLKRTKALLDEGVPSIFEASFREGGVFAAVDVLRRRPRGGFDLIEVKSSTKVKKEHLPDVAAQLWVCRKAGVDVRRVFVMHLDRRARFPDLLHLFRSVDVTSEAEALQEQMPRLVRRLRRGLAGPLPGIKPGDHCSSPHPCPFQERCITPEKDDHVTMLYRIGRRADDLSHAGITALSDLVADDSWTPIQRRQIHAAKARAVVVDADLKAKLSALSDPLGYLDFETATFALPRFSGCRSWDPVPAQFSLLVTTKTGAIAERSFLVDTSADPRRQFADALVEACRSVRTLLVWNRGFEARVLAELAEHVKPQKKALLSIRDRLVDLLPIVRDHVYHPAFRGSFSLKSVAPAIAPDVSYDDLDVGGGMDAAAMLFRLFADTTLTSDERTTIRAGLLRYCAMDTHAMVAVVRELRLLAKGPLYVTREGRR